MRIRQTVISALALATVMGGLALTAFADMHGPTMPPDPWDGRGGPGGGSSGSTQAAEIQPAP